MFSFYFSESWDLNTDIVLETINIKQLNLLNKMKDNWEVQKDTAKIVVLTSI